MVKMHFRLNVARLLGFAMHLVNVLVSLLLMLLFAESLVI